MTPDTSQTSLALMIDIETLATTPDARVVQVGYLLGDRRTGDILISPTNFWVDDEAGGRIDMDTVRWWMRQNPTTARGVFNDETGMVYALYTKLHEAAAGAEVWASPAMFDLPILTSLFKRELHADPKPWKYSAERDMMTLYKLIDPLGELQPPANEKEHDAAADALWQFQYLVRLTARLEGRA